MLWTTSGFNKVLVSPKLEVSLLAILMNLFFAIVSCERQIYQGCDVCKVWKRHSSSWILVSELFGLWYTVLLTEELCRFVESPHERLARMRFMVHQRNWKNSVPSTKREPVRSERFSKIRLASCVGPRPYNSCRLSLYCVNVLYNSKEFSCRK